MPLIKKQTPIGCLCKNRCKKSHLVYYLSIYEKDNHDYIVGTVADSRFSVVV